MSRVSIAALLGRSRRGPRCRSWYCSATATALSLVLLCPPPALLFCGPRAAPAAAATRGVARQASDWLREGDVVNGTVVKVVRKPGDVIVDTDCGHTGLLAFGELCDGFPTADVRLTTGNRVTARVLGEDGDVLKLTLRSGSQQRLPVPEVSTNPSEAELLPFSQLTPETWLNGVVISMKKTGVWVAVTPPTGGALVAGFLRQDAFSESYCDEAVVGGDVRVRVAHVNLENVFMQLSMRAPAHRWRDWQVGDSVTGHIVHILKNEGVLLDCDAEALAFLPVGEIQDGFPVDGVVRMGVGATLTARVLRKGQRVELTLRAGSLRRRGLASAARGQAKSVLAPFANFSSEKWVTGLIGDMTPLGVYVALRPWRGGKVAVGFLNQKDFERGFIKHAFAGRNVRVRVLGVDLAAGTLRLGARYAPTKPEDLYIGEKVSGVVTQVLPNDGVFVNVGVGKDAFIKAGELQDGFPMDGILLKKSDVVTGARVIERSEDKFLLTLRNGSLNRGPDHNVPRPNPDVSPLKKVDPGMWFKGSVHGMSTFGVFAIINMPESGEPVNALVHKDEFRPGYAESAMVGRPIRARLLNVDVKKRLVKLTMWPLREDREPQQKPHHKLTVQRDQRSEGQRPRGPQQRQPWKADRPPQKPDHELTMQRDQRGEGQRPRGPRQRQQPWKADRPPQKPDHEPKETEQPRQARRKASPTRLWSALMGT